MSNEPQFELELARLLAWLAAADGEVAPVEVNKIRELSRISAEAFEGIEASLAAGSPPEPDFEVLRDNPVAALAAAQSLVAADGVLADEELDGLTRLRERLR